MAADPVIMLPHDPAWSGRFATEAARLLHVFAGVALGVHHIGSTAVPGLEAKPILDVLLVAPSLGALDGRRPDAEARGYRWLGENGLPGRRYLEARRAAEGMVHVHAFVVGDPEVARHLDFRDYLICHPERAARYGRLKRELADRFRDDRAAYTDGKTAFVRETEALARAWRRSLVDDGGGSGG
ncbi:MAG: GrpB family protein [Deinococcales bacterium]